MPDTLRPPPPEAAKATAPVRSVERWAALKSTPLVWYRAACAGQQCSTPRLVVIDEAAYDAAILAAKTVECR